MTELLHKIALKKIAFFEDEQLKSLKHTYNKIAQRLNTQSDTLSDEARKELYKELMIVSHRINLYS